MNYRTVALVGLRLLAVWLIASAITFLPLFVSIWFLPEQLADQARNSTSAPWMRFLYLLPIVDRLLIAFLLWVFSPWLSRRLIPETGSNSSRSCASILVQGAIAIAGLVIAVTAVPTLISRSISTPHYVSAVGGSPMALMGWMYLAISGILVLLGLGMVFGVRRLHNLIFRRRMADT